MESSSLAPDGAGSNERPQKEVRIKVENGSSSLSTTSTCRPAKLDLLPSMPLDVLLEIFSHLYPIQLLRLSRTTKALRKILLHRSSTYVWKAALGFVEGFPARPKELSLPFWTSLIFDYHCQVCLASYAMPCDFILRVRYCGTCAKDFLRPKSELDKNNSLDQVILKCIPFSRIKHSMHLQGAYSIYRLISLILGNNSFYHLPDKLKLLEDMKSIDNDDRSATRDFIAKKEAEMEARSKHGRDCNEWIHRYMQRRERKRKEALRLRPAAICAKLTELGYQAEFNFLDNFRWAIYDRGPDFTKFNEHQHVKIPKMLTEKTWAMIKDDMVDYMTEISELRKENSRCAVVRDRRNLIHTAWVNWRALPENMKAYPPDALMPNAADVLEFDRVQTLVNSNHDAELDMDRDIIPCFTECLLKEITNWRKHLLHMLWSQLVKTKVWNKAKWEYPMNWEDRLTQLAPAVIVFQCKKLSTHFYWEQRRCLADVIFAGDKVNIEREILNATQAGQRAPVMWYPQFLHHQCASMTERPQFEKYAKMNECLSMQKEYAHCRHAPWDPEALEFDERASQATKNILDACGMDWKTTTTKELDELDPRVVCLKCSELFGSRCDSGERQVQVWCWRDAVQHFLGVHFADASVFWERLSPEDTAKARLLDEAERKKRNFYSTTRLRVWRCMKCRDTNLDMGCMSWASLRSHFACNPTHGNINDMADKDGIWYYRALDVFPREGPPIKMVLSKIGHSKPHQ
ncbi:hypothetical protein BDN70DRAFT_603950 [Pholiota conissans]|uniref:F-box domain-containing protein n=1 Tax=Pholiota conissans TaxID=109636 RepID=A0A9P5Z709_9AGAR|nr:hypothetical protein BDN70DRAFT_603950 [Pholiota conissans]